MDIESPDFWATLKADLLKADNLKIIFIEEIINDLKQALLSEFTGVSIYAFGSRALGVAVDLSDLDLFVDIGYGVYSETETKEALEVQLKIYKAIGRLYSKWTVIKTCGGRIPLVVVRHKSTKIRCDISFSNKMTYDQNRIVNYIFSLQPIARYMVIYLRRWVQKNQIAGFRVHILILMVIFFLQVRGKLPSVSELQSGLSPNIGPWITSYTKLGLSYFNMKPIALNESESRSILKDFFKYYYMFDFKGQVVSPWLGRKVSRFELQSIVSQRCKDCRGIDIDRAMIVQDLVHLNQNKAFSIDTEKFGCFVRNCGISI
ncbi:terminal uridylyltransferase Tailor-like [Drosophila ficusphila]|uniref:terminal uridylyltransferase Tailor-like n=1 Tax=Drosophila ficusphila TaxID=30025 RepID=UPI0007E85A15|nr:terminal uridylyltransferase Tailor-like [Drosophila ficusphila]